MCRAIIFYCILTADRGREEFSRETPSVQRMHMRAYPWGEGESAGEAHGLTIDLKSGIHSE